MNGLDNNVAYTDKFQWSDYQNVCLLNYVLDYALIW